MQECLASLFLYWLLGPACACYICRPPSLVCDELVVHETQNNISLSSDRMFFCLVYSKPSVCVNALAQSVSRAGTLLKDCHECSDHLQWFTLIWNLPVHPLTTVCDVLLLQDGQFSEPLLTRVSTVVHEMTHCLVRALFGMEPRTGQHMIAL